MVPTGVLRWTSALDRWPRPARLGLCCLLVALVGAADLVTSADVAFTLAYLLPVAIAAWHLGAGASTGMATASTVISLGVDLATQNYLPHPAIQTLNLVGQLCVFTFFGLILARLREQLVREQRLGATDPLTGLANRRAFWILVGNELQRGRRFDQSFSIAYLDVDGFKAVNDRYGHRSGDEVLVAVAHLLVASVRAVDCVARMGGDEFALLLPGTGQAGAEMVVSKLRANLAAAAWNQLHRLRCSVGCLTVEDPAATVDAVIARADMLMYAVKAGGKDGQRLEVLAPSPPVAER